MPTDTSEQGLESIIVSSLVEEAGYVRGEPRDYDREHAVDLVMLRRFLAATQPEAHDSLAIGQEGPNSVRFLHRLQGEITKRGIVDVLRGGVKHGPLSVDLFYGAPTPGNAAAAERFKANIFSVTRQLRYSRAAAALSIDLVVFINGLPVLTFELKNKLTKQTARDAVQQYRLDRDPKEPLFQFKRCLAHFAVDDHEALFCAHLRGGESWFLPFNKGHDDGAGNPPNPRGVATDYLWRETLSKAGLTDILENYAQVVEEKDEKTGRKQQRQIFPRYHQLKATRMLLDDVRENGVGRRYLIQHSAGSGKSNSIAWLAHQLVGLERDGKVLFDSIIVVTDRRVLDRQIRDTIKRFAQVSATVGHAGDAGDLLRFIKDGKKIIISTAQKFPFIQKTVGKEGRESNFAIVIDEAHSSQGGKTTAAMHGVLEPVDRYEGVEIEDLINKAMESRKMLANASYFAFTAMPKSKTLEVFGEPAPQPDGKVRHKPFHSYTMKQAVQEGFILDVLSNYTPVGSYYRLIKTVADDPRFDAGKAQKKLRGYVESHRHAIREKAGIMVDHFHDQVIGHRKIGGQARAMVVTNGIRHAVEYYHAFKERLKERKSPYLPVVAFSGCYEHGKEQVTETTLNRFFGGDIPSKIREDPYRFLIVADKYQTGYDEPLLHTMYVDKKLSGVKAVQTLSRLNRAHPRKHDTFVLDFHNDSEIIKKSFEPYYRSAVLSDKTDPDKLHDLKAQLDGYGVYSQRQVEELARLYLSGAARERLDPILDSCVAIYKDDLDEDAQVKFKGAAKAFARVYVFLASILPYSNADWEKLFIFLNFLIPKLPAPREDDLSRGILETIDMDSYRAEARAGLRIDLPDQDGEVEPIPLGGDGDKPEPEMERLSHIVNAFNDRFGDIDWKDADKVRKVIAEEIPFKVAADTAYQNAMKNNDKKTARLEHDVALRRIMRDMLSDHTELYRQFSDNPSFKKWLGDVIFSVTYRQ